MKYSSKEVHKGFTLIELIVVIVILGILSATAMPRFIELSGDARAAKVMAYYGATGSAAALANARCELDLGLGKPKPTDRDFCNAGSNGGISMGRASIQMVHKYPGATYEGINRAITLFTTNDNATESETNNALKTSDWELGVGSDHGGGLAGATQKVHLKAATDKTKCYVSYTSVKKLGDAPIITFDTSGC